MSADLLGNLVKTTQDALALAAGNVAGAAGVVVKTAGDAAGTVARGAGMAAGTVADSAGSLAGAVTSKAGEIAEAAKERSPESVVKRAKVSAFKDGVNEGANRMANKAYAYSFALVALTTYAARCDGSYDDVEVAHIKKSLKHLIADEGIPQAIREQFNDLACNESLAFDDVAEYLDELGLATLENLRGELNATIEADGRVTAEEEAVLKRFEDYVEGRRTAEAASDE